MVWLVTRGIGWQVISAISCAPPERHVPLKAQPANEAGKADVRLKFGSGRASVSCNCIILRSTSQRTFASLQTNPTLEMC